MVKTGRCIFTVPIIIGRLTRSRSGTKDSYHGNSDRFDNDCIVRAEFGANMWRFALEAGFTSARIHSFEYASALAIEVTVSNERQT